MTVFLLMYRERQSKGETWEILVGRMREGNSKKLTEKTSSVDVQFS